MNNNASLSQDNLKSITAMVIAVGCFSLMDTVLKLLSARYPALQIAALRGLCGLPLILVFITARGAWGTVWRVRWPLHLLRGALGIAMLTLFTTGVRELPLSATYTLFFIAVVGRFSSRTDSTESMVLWMMVIVAVGASALAWPNWVPLQASDWPLLLALGITGFCGQLAITVAFRHGQASAVAPFEYTALAWGVGLDWLIWQTLPQSHTWLGAAIIVGSGLFLVRREKRITEAHATAERP
jgi:drug/metabolite transporter (DMT)-like permease